MPSLPIPVFTALILLFFFLRLLVRRRRPTSLAMLVGLAAAQSLIIALAQHYRVAGAGLVQPISATAIPPAALMTYLVTAVRPARGGDLIHLLLPAMAVAALLTAPAFLDVLVPGGYAVYGLALIVQAARGPDEHPRLALQKGEMPSRIWVFIGAALVASALSDVLIAAAMASGSDALRPWIVSLFHAGNLLLIGLLVLSGPLQDDDAPETDAARRTGPPDADVWERIERHMREERPYLDPDLTLARLSRKLGVPAKALSTTINRATRGNVSRYVNAARIAEAQRALLAGESVTNAMLSSGFNTKSNFNREFLRVAGRSPSAWLAEETRGKEEPA